MSPIEGPYKTLRTSDGLEVPWYVIPFDKKGRCKGPRTRAQLLSALQDGGFTHVFLFSHGWNNDWKVATDRYEHFARGFTNLRLSSGAPMPSDYRPVMVGVFWPSTSLVLPWERGPRIAAADPSGAAGEDVDAFADDFDRSIDVLAEDLPEDRIERFYELVGSERLDADGVRELAGMLSPSLGRDDELAGYPASPEDPAELAEAWLAGARLLEAHEGTADDEDDDEADFGAATTTAGADAPEAAGLRSLLDPRHGVRMATVWKMKDRAGTVGAHGVHPLLRDVLGVTTAPLHVVGHSYGCKVMMSAVAFGELPRPVASALLLQPAISGRAFAVDCDGKGHPGGYRVVLGRIVQPIVSTFSSHDFPLSRTFHLAVRRKSDLGEQRIAAGPPSRFAALGGYGPVGLASGEGATVEIRDPGQPYDELLQSGLEVLALAGSRCIKGHGDISQPATYWALQEQVRASNR